ncbi:zinc finger protein 281 isoform X2 [Spea bombifrons]|uniref:zinc finger protein 281 isoform X2 n=1 Tax=Spea bombifrons TaxID=233779 RepID=UPI00234B0FA3|nr:zinc finger protein 281 isoform X2 [Spea bombifrons]
MEPTFPPSMIMFSHLPPVTTFARLGSDLMQAPPPLPGPGDMILKKEPGSPPHPGDFLHSLTGIKQEKMGEHEQYRFYGDRPPEIVEVTVGSQGLIPELGLNRESLGGDCEAANLSPNQKPHICEHCSAAFRSSYHLRRHVLIHTGERPFQCSQCNMSFIQKYLLQRHEKIHSGEKPFNCDQCNMKFIQKYHMERHKRTHSGEKPYKCDTCQQFFSRTDRLLKHKRTCGETINKGSMEPGSSNPNLDSMSGNFDLSQGNFSGRKKGKSRNGLAHKDQKPGNKLNEAQMAPNLNIQNYSVDLPIVSSSSGSPGAGMDDLNAKVPKLVFKKVNRKNAEKNDLSLEPQSNMAIQKLSEKANSPLDMVGSSGVDTMNLLQSGVNKGHTSSNYDDAMQFLKKRRYLQANNSNSAYAVNVGHMVTQQSVIHSAVSSVMDGENPLTLIDSQSLNVDIKNCQDKSVIPDEVLQSILDHYTHKSVVHPDVPFNISEHHVDMHATGDGGDLVQEENVCSDSQSTSNDKTNMFQEYSKYLQQALERTSHTSTFPLGPSLQFVSLSSSLANPSLFSDKHIYTTSPLECGFNQPLNSVLPSSMPKSHFGMVVGPQSGFSLSLESTHQQLTPSQELADQIDPQKTLDSSSSYQISSQELNGQKDQQKNLDSASGFHLQTQELSNALEEQKDNRPRATCQIENFAQAFGSQFKSGNRVPISFNTTADGGVDHRLRTSTPEFSGYSNLLSEVVEAGSARVKTSSSQSFSSYTKKNPPDAPNSRNISYFVSREYRKNHNTDDRYMLRLFEQSGQDY